jgi:PTH1 family peptidyl-tRNA hydrolase
MALFQKRPEVANRINYTSFGLNKTLLIVGLGNPGEEYAGTRHNIGFKSVDEFARKNNFDPWATKKDLQCEITQATLNDTRVLLCKPTTFMNLSGEAVQAITHFYKISAEQLIVVHDELDINFGQLMGEQYGRVRIGIGPKLPAQMDTADFVLQDFSKTEQTKLPALLREVTAVLSEYAYGSAIAAETRSFL